jgi:hypothetical protein
MTTQNIPNWKKGDIICLLGDRGGVIHIFEAEHDPYYGKTFFSSNEDWYYGLRNCEELRLANQEDIDKKIKYQTENVERETAVLDQLLNFRERLSNV